jgi:UDP-N-acetylmuramoyl-tripeptide--D-alanyl-D-alanine ligase
MKWKVRELMEVTRGRLLKGEQKMECKGISTDSRTIKKGELFIPLKGNQFDGHDFIPQVLVKGASGVMVRKGFSLSGISRQSDKLFIIEVSDCLDALGDLAHFLRMRSPVKVVAITGSNGKTSTKEMSALVLQKQYQVLKNEGNLNNLIGLPLTLLRLSRKDEVAVLEMGMNRPGEIRRLSKISQPNIGLITNIGPVHLEGLGSLAQVQEAKGELFETLTEDDCALINYDDSLVKQLASRCRAKKISFGFHKASDIRAQDVCFLKDNRVCFQLISKGEEVRVVIPALGLHHVYNALAASAVGIALGVNLKKIAERLKGFRPLPGRSKVFIIGKGVRLIDETYNANPRSMEIALKTLMKVKGRGRGIAILGDMRELGDDSPFWHREVGKCAGDSGIEYLVLLGQFAPFVAEGAESAGLPKARIFIGRTHEDIALQVKGILKRGDWILIKGSREMQMEKVMDFLLEKKGDERRAL